MNTLAELRKRESPSYHLAAYDVLVGGELIGEVYSMRRNRHSKKGRLIYRTTSAVKWYCELAYKFREGRTFRPEHDTRKKAVERLVGWYQEV